MRFKLLAILMLLSTPLYAGVTSYDNTFTNNDIHSSTFAAKLNRNFQQSLTGGINNVESANITNDTLTEADMADEINPRVRTYEGAACEFVYTGLLPVTDADLTTDTAAGTAYPRGFRIKKSAATAHTYTASKWTWVDIDQNGDFQYSELPIGSATPSVAANSIRLARVSTDGATVNSVQDLRTTSCTSGPFDILSDSTGESNLDDLMANGQELRQYSNAGRTPNGLARGAFVSWDTHTTFKVTTGSLYINGEYRTASSDITVTTAADDPTNGGSGLDTGAIGASKIYNVFAIADQDSVKPYSVTYSEASVPAGVTNYRLLGRIKTDATSLFSSRDVMTVHGISEQEMIDGSIDFNGSGTVAINKSFNVSALTDNGTGDYTITWETDFDNAFYRCVITSGPGSSLGGYGYAFSKAVGSVQIRIANPYGAGLEDSSSISVIATGD